MDLENTRCPIGTRDLVFMSENRRVLAGGELLSSHWTNKIMTMYQHCKSRGVI